MRIRGENWKIFAVVFLGVLSAIAFGEELPTSFVGTVNASIQGSSVPAPINSIVIAKIDGIERRSFVVLSAGSYSLLVPGDSSIDMGKPITFAAKTPTMRDFVNASENSTYASGSIMSNFTLTLPLDNVSPTLIGSVSPDTLAYDNSGPVDIASVGSCADSGYGLHSTEPLRISYADMGTSQNTSCSGATAYNVSTGWGNSQAISFAGTDGHYYCIRLECKDAAENVGAFYSADNILYDISSPVTGSSLSGITGYNGWYLSDVNVTLTCVDSSCDTTLYNYTTSGWTAYSTPVIASAEGNNSFSYYSNDSAGNVETTSTIFIAIDKTKPSSSATSPEYVNSGAIDVSFTANDATSGVALTRLYYRLNGGSWNDFGLTLAGTSGTFAFNPAGVDGNYSFYTAAVDNAGNVEDAPGVADTYTIYDTAPPVVDAGTDKITNVQVTQDATATDALSGVASYSWTKVSGPGNITFGSATSEDTIVSADADGTYVLRLTVTDVAGNSASGDVTLVWDTVNPTSSATIANAYYGPNNWVAASTINGVAADTGGSGVAFVTITVQRDSDANYWNGTSWEVAPTNLAVSGTTSWTYTFDAANLGNDINYTITPTAADVAGNSAVGTAGTFTYDNAAPVTSDDVPSGWQTSAVAVTLSCTDVGSGCSKVYYTTDRSDPTTSSPFVNASSSWAFTVSGDGTYDVKYRGEDVLGNLEAVETAVNSLQLDTAAPVVGEVSVTPYYEGYVSGISNISAPVSDVTSGVASCDYTLDDGVTWEVASYANGTCSISGVATSSASFINIRGTDTAGLTGDGTSVEVTPDVTAPLTSDNAPYGWQASDVNLTLSPSDDASGVANTYYCVNQTDSCDPTTSGTSVFVTAEGTNYVRYYSVDNVDNAENVKSVTVQLDKTSPTVGVVTITPFKSGEPNYVSGMSNISASVSDDTSGVASCEYTLGGDVWGGASYANGTCSISGADTSSAYSINVRGTDNANWTGVGYAVVVTPDTVSPAYSFNTPSVDSYYKDGGSISVDATITESGSGITDGATCTPEIDGAAGSFTGTVTYSSGTGTCAGTLTLGSPSGLSDGAHQLTLTVADNVGNALVSANRQIQVDNTNPSAATVTAPAASSYRKGTFDITATGTDAIGVQKVEFYDGNPVSGGTKLGEDTSAPYAYSWATTSGDDGSHTVYARVIDNANNYLDSSGVMFIVDNTAPASSVLTSGNLNSMTYTVITGNASDSSGVSSVQISINRTVDGAFWNGSAWVSGVFWLNVTGTTNWNYSFSPEEGQTYAVSSRAADVAGNVQTGFGTATFTYANNIGAYTVPFTSTTSSFNLSSTNITETSLTNGNATENGTVMLIVPLSYGGTSSNVTLNLTLLNGSTRKVYSTSEGIIISPQSATLTNMSVVSYSTSSETNRTIALNMSGTGVQDVLIYTGSFGKPSYLRFEYNSSWVTVSEGVGLWTFSYDASTKIAVARVQFGSPHVLETIWRTVFSPPAQAFYYSGGGSVEAGLYSFSITAPSSLEIVAGNSATASIGLKNTGNQNLGAVSWALEGTAKDWASIGSATLPVNADTSVSLSISVPAGTKADSYSLTLTGTTKNYKASRTITILVTAPVVEAAAVIPPVETPPAPQPPAEVAPSQPAPEAPAEAPAPEVAVPAGPTGLALAAQRLTASPASLLVVVIIAVLAVAAYLRPRLR